MFEKFKQVGATIGITLTIVFILAFISYSAWTDSRSKSVQGKITDVSLCIDRRVKSGKRGSTTQHTCQVTTTYVVNGTSYTIRESQTSTIAPLIGTPVTVYYDPSDPSNGTMMSMGVAKWGLGILAIIVLLIGIGIAIYQFFFATASTAVDIAEPLIPDIDVRKPFIPDRVNIASFDISNLSKYGVDVNVTKDDE